MKSTQQLNEDLILTMQKTFCGNYKARTLMMARKNICCCPQNKIYVTCPENKMFAPALTTKCIPHVPKTIYMLPVLKTAHECDI
jgi:hypothetical protein